MLTSGEIGEDLDHVILQVPVINHTADTLTQTTEDVQELWEKKSYRARDNGFEKACYCV